MSHLAIYQWHLFIQMELRLINTYFATDLQIISVIIILYRFPIFDQFDRILKLRFLAYLRIENYRRKMQLIIGQTVWSLYLL